MDTCGCFYSVRDSIKIEANALHKLARAFYGKHLAVQLIQRLYW